MTSLIDAAIMYLSERNYSEKELRNKLELEFRSVPDLDKGINSVITRLKELQILNERQFAINVANHYSHKGDRFIKRILEQKGIKYDLIEEAISSLLEERFRALDEVHRHLLINANKKPNDVCRFLAGRNFSVQTIEVVLQKINDIKLKEVA
ncbi:regulatory protein RecX [Legionella saoudiensis]|uniref:regulatory protein RecX n=1 Tax=Legionella saoudiensis TaxID=1750561 RepID=UPI000730326C|nr:RecX family transcriptional regulator [Legionella saoudiensis]